MRKSSQSKAKIAQFLKKAVDLHTRGRLKSIHFELEGKRFHGAEMENLVLSDKDVKFFVGKEHFTVKLEEVTKYKRLRTQKYLFFVTKMEGSEEKVEKKVANKKVTKKAESKKAPKEDKGE